VTVRTELGIRALADTLAAKQVIGSKPLFLFYSWYYNYGSRIRPGRHRLSVGTGERRALKLLSGEEPALVMVTIPEGLTMWQTASVLDANGVCDSTEFIAACHDTALLRATRIPYATAEGFLFPETYEFVTGTKPAAVVSRLAAQFWSVYPELESVANMLADPGAMVILASIVEREARVPPERPVISGVFRNRLHRNLPFQSCATVEYLLPERRGRLSVEDTKLESPYNTYLHTGLPPGPICSPGRASLLAALRPERHDYLFFVARGDGTHIFSRTATEHAAATRDALRDK
jgi:UPF0755 protein